MEIIIVAKTRMNNQFCCVGGLELANNQNVRLLCENGDNQPNDTIFSVGYIWDIEYTRPENIKPPHTEDIHVYRASLLAHQIRLGEFLLKRVNVWRGGPYTLFDGVLCATYNGSGFVRQGNGIPHQSTGYWISDHELTRFDCNNKVRFHYSIYSAIQSLPYVGIEKPVQKIPQGVLLRVSLARWWKSQDVDEERCYLQLSGWYDN